jgi:membrane protease YdiL (CAAX protease family)
MKRSLQAADRRRGRSADMKQWKVSDMVTDETVRAQTPETGRDTAPTIPLKSARKQAILEVLVFLFLIVPSMVLSFFVTRQGKVNFVFVSVSTILRDLALVCLILFFLWRNGEPVSVVGWRSRHLERNIFFGVVLYLPLVFVLSLVEQLLSAAGLSQPAVPAPSLFDIRGRWEIALAVTLIAVVAVSEETIFRGYLTARLSTATRSTTAAVLLSAVIFALGHGYEGSLGVVTVGVMGLAFNLIYLWRKSLVTPIVLHFLQDFTAIIVLRYLQGAPSA